jgi:hypothetical protein
MAHAELADDLATIRARVEELRRERERGLLKASCSRTNRGVPPECIPVAARDRRGARMGSTVWPAARQGRGGVGWSRSEQLAEQLGAVAKAHPLNCSRARKFAFNVRQHLRQRHRERKERSVQIGGGHGGSCDRLARPLPASGTGAGS